FQKPQAEMTPSQSISKDILPKIHSQQRITCTPPPAHPSHYQQCQRTNRPFYFDPEEHFCPFRRRRQAYMPASKSCQQVILHFFRRALRKKERTKIARLETANRTGKRTRVNLMKGI
ncbi:MAG TPA: hypothetical protein VM689_16650, partial [Aliidongia sp.]|nr:hypothetical protein [Aliidongia sp.]